MTNTSLKMYTDGSMWEARPLAQEPVRLPLEQLSDRAVPVTLASAQLLFRLSATFSMSQVSARSTWPTQVGCPQ